MRAFATFAATGLLILAACTQFGGTASNPSPSLEHRSSPSPSASTLPSPTQAASPTPTPFPSPPPSLYLLIQQDDYGFLSAVTQPGASCSARAILPNGQDAPGLHNPQVADANGNVVWRYPTPDNSPGTGTHIVSCSYNGLSGTTSALFTEGN